MGSRMESDLIERVRARTLEDPSSGCWLWQGALNKKNGYGLVQIEGRQHVAHRAMYEQYFGPIPKGLESHHVCFNKHCCNPAHILLVTKAEHLQWDRTSNLLLQGRGGRRPRKDGCVKRYTPRAQLGPAELAATRAHARTLGKKQRKGDPEHVRALERAKYARRMARDREGFLAARRAQALRRRQNKVLA